MSRSTNWTSGSVTPGPAPRDDLTSLVDQAPDMAPDQNTNGFTCYIEEIVFQHGVGFVVGGWLTFPASSTGFKAVFVVDRVPVAGTFRYFDRSDLPSRSGGVA